MLNSFTRGCRGQVTTVESVPMPNCLQRLGEASPVRFQGCSTLSPLPNVLCLS